MRPAISSRLRPITLVAPRVYAAVFAGALVGGAVRLGIDEAFTLDAWSWDIVSINLVGSALLGALTGWFAVREAPWWIPGLGTGVLGGFTTFSSMAAPHPDAPVPGLVLLVATLMGASLAAALGWATAESIASRHGTGKPPLDIERAESEVEGFDGFDDEAETP